MENNAHNFLQRFIKKPRWRYTVIFGVLLLLNACGGGNSGAIGKLVKVPQDANFVVSINFKSLSAKNKDFYKILPEESIDLKKTKVLQKLINKGIDLSGTALVFGKTTKEQQQVYVAINFILKDVTAFEKALNELENKAKIGTSGGIKYAYHDNNLIGWKGQTALIVGIDDASEETLLKKMKEFLATKSSESLSAKNKDYQKFIRKSNDISMWIDYDNAEDYLNFRNINPDSKALAEVAKASMYSTVALNFENGKVVLDVNSFLDKNLKAAYKEVFKKTIANKIIRSIPIKTPSSLLGLAVNMKPLYEILKTEEGIINFDKTPNPAKLSSEDLFDLFNGDFLLTTETLQIQDALRSKYNPDMVLAVGINNKKTLEKLISAAEEINGLNKKGDYYEAKVSDYTFYLIEKGDILYLTSTEKMKDDILKGKGSMQNEQSKVAEGNGLVMYLNLQEIIKQLPAAWMGFIPEDTKENLLPQLGSVSLAMKEFEDYTSTTNLTINFTDKNKNSLVTILEIMEKMKEAGLAMN